MKLNSKNIGIGSFAFRYHIGTKSFRPPEPMTVLGFINQAHILGYGCVQLYNNLNVSEFDVSMCRKIKRLLDTYDMAVDLGLNELTQQSLDKHLSIAELIEARSLRVTIGEQARFTEDHHGVVEQNIRLLLNNLKRIEQTGIIICVENHFGLPTSDVCSLVTRINHPQVRCICDTTNSIAFIERPEETLRQMGCLTYCLHIKDFAFEKPESGYFMNGAILGHGEQKTQRIIEQALKFNPNVQIVLEMTITRDPAMDAVEVLKWELDSVESSTKELYRILEVIEKDS